MDYDWDAYYLKPAADVFAIDPVQRAHFTPKDRGPDALVYDELRESLALRMPREVSACVALSGGIESSLMAYLATREALSRNISQFVTVGFEDPGCNESARAAELAETLSITDKHAVIQFPEHELLAYLTRCVEAASAPLEHPHYLSCYLPAVPPCLPVVEGADHG